jgi:two-component system sensor histidine kinase KdpD
VRVVLLLPEGESIAVRAGYPPEDLLDEADLAAAKWCWQNNRPAGRDADTLPGARRLFLPIRTARGAVGVVGVDSDRPGPLLTPDQRRLLDALSDQTALAIERVNLADDLDRAKIVAETDRLRSALLTSLSHDLRTPLASILGSATTLDSYGPRLDERAMGELTSTIREEAERLNRFIANLLDMSRIEAGALKPKSDFVDVAEVARAAVDRAGKAFAGQTFSTSLARDLPFIRGDANLLEQVLFNLLDNAQKYGGGGKVSVHARPDGASVLISVTDEGPGIKPADLDRIFEKFYRGGRPDGRKAGTGLGLSISRGLIEAMGGKIWAESPAARRRGTRVVIALPAAEAPQLAKTAT